MTRDRPSGGRRRWMTYEEALARHPGCHVDLAYRRIDGGYPDAEKAPVATAPAIFVWPTPDDAAGGDEGRCIAVYWLRDVD